MTLADTILPIAYSARAIAGQLGFRPYTVALLLTYANANQDSGQVLASDSTPITEANGQPPKIRQEKAEDTAGTGSAVSDTFIVGPITPAFPGGGTDLTELIGTLDAGVARYLLITGPKHPEGARYRILDVNCDKALGYRIRCQGESKALHGFYAPL